MAATHLTLEEAAERLGLSPEEFKKRLKTHPAFKTLVPIRDGSTLRFKSAAIEELARELGAGSNPENPALPVAEHHPPESEDFRVHLGDSEMGDDAPLRLADSEDVEFSLSTDEPSRPAGPKSGKSPKSDSDSDVRLDGGKKKEKGDKGAETVPTEEISIDFSGPGSATIKGGSSAKLSAPKSSGKLTSDSGKSLSKPGAPGTGDSSEFELSLDADSDDFELKLNTEASDEVELGNMPKGSDSASGRRGGESGILSRKPADSGISLEKGKGGKPASDSGKGHSKPATPSEDSDSDVDFELTLDSSAAVSGTKLGAKGKKPKDDSDSEFELTLDDSGGSSLEQEALSEAAEKGDIFETDFEIPPMDESGSEAVALETSDTDLEKSDFDVALEDSDAGTEESGSEVVLLEDEDEAPKAKKGKPAKKAVADDDDGDVDLADVEEADEEDASVSKALKGAKKRRDDDEDEEEEAAAAVPAGAYRPVPWGVFPAIFLMPAVLFVLIGSIMAYEQLQTMWGYQQPTKPTAPLTKWVAGTFDMELKDQ
jgi:hypothetical protein